MCRPPLDVPLEQQRVVAEGGCRLSAGGSRRQSGRSAGVADDAHALAAAAGSGLDQQREADLGGDARRGRRRARTVGGGHDRHAGRDRDLAGLVLAAHRVHDVGGRADEDEPGFGDSPGERGPLGQEAVAGVDRVGAGSVRRRRERRDRQVGLGGGGRADADRDVGLADVRRVPVGVAVDGDAQPRARSRDARLRG